MKKLIISTILQLSTLTIFAQTYNFSKRSETYYYRDQHGQQKEKFVGTTNGAYKFVFEKDVQKGNPLFTLYINGVEDQWYYFGGNYGRQEKDGELYTVDLYLATTSRYQLYVAYTHTKSKITLIRTNGFVEYHN